jgi:hypothetical protein
LQLASIRLTPAPPAAAPRATLDPRPGGAAPSPVTETVPLIDDDPGFREAYRELLALEGYAVAEAGAAPKAPSELRRMSACLVVLDLMLPPSGRPECKLGTRGHRSQMCGGHRGGSCGGAGPVAARSERGRGRAERRLPGAGAGIARPLRGGSAKRRARAPHVAGHRSDRADTGAAQDTTGSSQEVRRVRAGLGR